MPNTKLKKLIYAREARQAVLKADPKLAYCIDSIKEVDAVKVVRCKKCKHCEGMFCYHPEQKYLPIYPEHFCSRGERKDNAT